MVHFVDISLRGEYLIFTIIIGDSSHLVNHLYDLRIFSLYCDEFPDTFKFRYIPYTSHQSPRLIKFMFVNLVLTEIFRNIVQIIFQCFFLNFLSRFKQSRTFLSHFYMISLLLFFYHLLPDAIIIITTFLTKFSLIEMRVESILFILISNLLYQGLPTVFLFL